MLAEFGELDDFFYNSTKHFCFVKLDYRANAERCKSRLGKVILYRNQGCRTGKFEDGSGSDILFEYGSGSGSGSSSGSYSCIYIYIYVYVYVYIFVNVYICIY
jgi:hypothetical protein